MERVVLPERIVYAAVSAPSSAGVTVFSIIKVVFGSGVIGAVNVGYAGEGFAVGGFESLQKVARGIVQSENACRGGRPRGVGRGGD